jgi:hypothetical protein
MPFVRVQQPRDLPGDVKGLPRVLLAPLLKAAEIEDVVDKAREPLRFAADRAQILAALRGVAHAPLLQELCEEPDGREGRLEFMGNVGDKGGLLPCVRLASARLPEKERSAGDDGGDKYPDEERADEHEPRGQVAFARPWFEKGGHFPSGQHVQGEGHAHERGFRMRHHARLLQDAPLVVPQRVAFADDRLGGQRAAEASD